MKPRKKPTIELTVHAWADEMGCDDSTIIRRLAAIDKKPEPKQLIPISDITKAFTTEYEQAKTLLAKTKVRMLERAELEDGREFVSVIWAAQVVDEAVSEQWQLWSGGLQWLARLCTLVGRNPDDQAAEREILTLLRNESEGSKRELACIRDKVVLRLRQGPKEHGTVLEDLHEALRTIADKLPAEQKAALLSALT